ncbi:MAG: hypothetical protein E6640_01625 [Actinomyces urogenitalis]|uniref:hypothetical protein n=1 Tax=Actinomyces urogenitalis TaxID=103621 RepID=UPI00290AB91E|nr:hypothetical protein [Actinomyces urogenitalis]MDU6150910.1 hypothetical protein [Actinomyces urogenitalis]
MTRSRTDVLQRVVLGLLIVAVALMVLAPTASAATGSTGSPSATGSCTAVSGGGSSPLLPVNRYADYVTTFHSRLDADAWNDVSEKLSRHALSGMYMGIGNAIWSFASSLLYASSTFCPINSMGYMMDTIVGTIGNAVTTSGLLAVLVAFTIITAIMRTRRGASFTFVLKEGAKTALVMGLIALMMAGATHSTEAGPGKGSPWWWVKTADASVNIVSSALAEAAGGVEAGSGYQPVYDGSTPSALSCYVPDNDASSFMHKLSLAYDGAYSTPVTDPGTLAQIEVMSKGAELPKMVSRLWESIALPAWAGAQFGTDNPWTDQVWCFALEAERRPDNKMDSYWVDVFGEDIRSARGRIDKTHAFRVSSTEAQDRALVGWAACQVTDLDHVSARKEWAGLAEQAVTDDDCAAWLSGDKDLAGTSLDWADDPGAIIKATPQDDQVAVRDYLNNLHGKNGSNTSTSMFLFMVGSIVVGAVFLLLALLQAAAKLILTFMILGVFLTLVKSLSPGDDAAAFKKAGAQVLGASFVAGCAGLMISIIMMVSVTINASMSGLFPAGSAGKTMVVCLSPLIGVALIHFIFASVLGLPSPFTLKGAMAWGTGIVGGLIGGSVVAGAAGLGSQARSAGSALASRLGGKGSGKGQSDPRKVKAGEVNPDAVCEAENKSGDDRSASQQAADAAGLDEAKAASEAEKTSDETKDGDEDGQSTSLRDKLSSARDAVEDQARKNADNDGRLGQDVTGKDRRRAARQLLKAKASAGVGRATSAVTATKDCVVDKAAWVKAHPGQAIRTGARVGAGAAFKGTGHAARAAINAAGAVGSTRIGRMAAMGAAGAVAVGAAPVAMLAAPAALATASYVRRGRHTASAAQTPGASADAQRHAQAQQVRTQQTQVEREQARMARIQAANAQAQAAAEQVAQDLPPADEPVGYDEQ